MNRTTCDLCGKEYGIGDSPFCRDGHAGGGRYGHGAFTPYDDPMIGAHGETVHFGNWGEKLRYMEKHGIVPSDEAPIQKARERAREREDREGRWR